MAITVVGSVAFDTIETPAGRRERCLGGAATYFALAASYFTPVQVIAVVGEDFGHRQEAAFTARGIDIRGIERAKGKSFFWAGNYLENLNEAKTETTELNVFGEFSPKIPDAYKDSEYLFLANIDPVLQKQVHDAMPQAKLVCGDTMNYWINDHRANLLEVLKGLDVLLINDMEARLLTGERNPVKAAKGVLALGPQALVVKHGEYGATVYFGSDRFSTDGRAPQPFRAPALPLDEVVDPTGAGDSFAGGMMGYLATQGTFSSATIKRALAFGTVVASYTIADFSLGGLQKTDRDQIDDRWHAFKQAMSF